MNNQVPSTGPENRTDQASEVGNAVEAQGVAFPGGKVHTRKIIPFDYSISWVVWKRVSPDFKGLWAELSP